MHISYDDSDHDENRYISNYYLNWKTDKIVGVIGRIEWLVCID